MAPETMTGCSTPNNKASDLDAERLAAICKALAHPARIAIFARLKQINRCVCGQIVEVLPLAQSTVSQHLKILKTAGMIQGQVQGARTCYCVNPLALAELKALLEKI